MLPQLAPRYAPGAAAIRPVPERKTGWIEWPRKGTKNPKRYPNYRRWVRQGGESWRKETVYRADLDPLDEETYVQFKRQQHKARQDARRARRRHSGDGR